LGSGSTAESIKLLRWICLVG